MPEEAKGRQPSKVALLYDVIYPWSIGGGEKIIWELARRLARRGHDVSILSSKMWSGERELTREGVRCVGICPWLSRSNNLGNRSILQPLLFAWSALVHLSRHRYDVVISNAFPYLPCFAARLAAGINPAPLAITWYEARGRHGWRQYAGNLLGECAALLERWTARLSRHNSTISDFTAKRMISLLGMSPDNVVVIPCGVDVAEFAPRSLIRPEQSLLYVGRMVRHKRIDLLIEAFSRVAREFPDLKLKLVGPGAERENLQQLATARGVADRVVFIDTLVGEPLQEEYRRSTAFVLPSEIEGFGMVLIEAMAAGIPVIARRSRHSAAASVITDGVNGLVFTELEDLVQAIRRLCRDPDLRAHLVAGGAETARRYDWDSTIVPQFESWFSDIVGRPEIDHAILQDTSRL